MGVASTRRFAVLCYGATGLNALVVSTKRPGTRKQRVPGLPLAEGTLGAAAIRPGGIADEFSESPIGIRASCLGPEMSISNHIRPCPLDIHQDLTCNHSRLKGERQQRQHEHQCGMSVDSVRFAGFDQPRGLGDALENLRHDLLAFRAANAEYPAVLQLGVERGSDDGDDGRWSGHSSYRARLRKIIRDRVRY